MDLSTTLSVVQTILTVIQTLGQLQLVCSISNCKSQLDDLEDTIRTVRAVLEDADAKQDSINSQDEIYVKQLQDVVYDADDVLDEFLTLAKQNRLRRNKVTSFFSQFKFLTHNLSSKVTTVNDKLTTITTKREKVGLKDDYKPEKYTKEETSSFLYDKIIGREEEVKNIIGMLLGSNNVDDPHVSFLAVWGMGGLGKTALARLVYNDPRISEAFPLKRWTCIADQDQKQLDVRAFCGKVVKGLSVGDKTSLEDVQSEAIKQLEEGEKYFFVLDDMWTECYDEWQKFKGILEVGKRGSRVMVTTRSEKTAKMIGGEQVLKLGGLSEHESWHLFERMAFEKEERDDELVKLGKEIVKKCTNVPLAIRVVGSSLRGQPKSTWFDYRDKGLDCLSRSDDKITPILMLSYYQLNSWLKACFTYCAIFPKDWEINTQMLIQLWLAQDLIKSENLGEQYIRILLQRCFFQDILEDDCLGIVSFKIHDLWHDIAEKVADEEICRLNFKTSVVGQNVRHLSFVSAPHTRHTFNSTHIRTCVQIKGYWKSSVDQLLVTKTIVKWTCLRSLDLRNTQAKSLPESIGQLLHLRSLNLSFNRDLKALPNSITKLVNLQTLDLNYCRSLKQVPDGVSKLVDLSTLNFAECDALRRMPANISMLTCLHTLCKFVVGVRANSTPRQCFNGLKNSTPRQCFNGLKDLQHLDKLKGSLEIQIVLKNAKFVKEEHGGGAYLRTKKHLETIVIDFRREDEYGSRESEQALLEEMQPHSDVKTLKLWSYHGETMPRWPGKGHNSALFDLPNLVTLEIKNCSELLYLPWQIGKLPHLKTLQISALLNIEYVVDVNSETPVSGEGSSFFPSLDILVIEYMPKLKGWWRKTEVGSQVVNPNDGGSSREANLEWISSPCFPLLRKLTLKNCEKMMFVPICPQLEYLTIHDSIIDMRCIQSHQPPLSYPKLKRLQISNIEWLKSTPIEYSQFLVEIHIWGDNRMERLGEVNEFPTCLLSSLRTLCIENCPNLKSVGGWLEHLSALEELCIKGCPKVELGGMSWHNLAPTLQSLELNRIEEMEELPEGMQYCTSLRCLTIRRCPQLKSMPKWIPKLTSLQSLTFWHCSESLIERCQQLNGEDWPLIQHISQFRVW